LKAIKRAKILREGFERGAQWAVMDLAARTGSFGIVDANGSITAEERAIIMQDLLLKLFVPKPESKS
jgi:hypothetical protein